MPPKRQVHWWTTQERHTVFILYTEYNQTNEECSQLFCHHFGHLFPTPPDAGRIRDEFASRDEPTRSKMWERQIERTTYTQQQETERAEARRLIHVAAQALGITLRPVVGAVAPVQPAPAPAAGVVLPTNDDRDDTSSTLSSSNASPSAQPIPATQGYTASDGDVASPAKDKGKRAAGNEEDVTEDEAGEEDFDSDEEEEEETPAPALRSRSGLVRTPVPVNKGKQQGKANKARPAAKKTPSSKTRRNTRQTTREEDLNRHARPGFPEKYGHMARHQFVINSRLLPKLDNRHALNFWKDEPVIQKAAEETNEQAVGRAAGNAAQATMEKDIEEVAQKTQAQRPTVLQQRAGNAAETLFARIRAAQIANGTITDNQPIQIFKPAAAATLAAAEEDLGEDEDVVMMDIE